MYYTEVENGIQSSCSGSAYPSLEKIIPDQASVKPDYSYSNDADKQLDHHDMDAAASGSSAGMSQLNEIKQHDIQKQRQNNNNINKSPFFLSPSLINDFLPLLQSDYDYDDIERSRDRSRLVPSVDDFADDLYDSDVANFDNEENLLQPPKQKQGGEQLKPKIISPNTNTNTNKVPLVSKFVCCLRKML